MASTDLVSLVLQARRVAGAHTNGDCADLLGVSKRTVIRHNRVGGASIPQRYERLIRAVHPKDRALAAKLAAAANQDLAALRLSGPGPSTRPELADTVVYAAADALGVAPKQARPAVIAAFARATALGLDLKDLAASFAAEGAAPAKKGEAQASRFTSPKLRIR